MEENQDKTIDPLKVIWSRKWQLLIFATAVTIAAYIFSSYLPKTYQAKTTILPIPPRLDSDKKKADFLSMNSYKDLVMTSGFLQSVIDIFKSENPNATITLYPKKLEGMISLKSSTIVKTKNQIPSALITFEVTGHDPKVITKIANILANLLAEESRKLRANEIATISRVTQAQYISSKNALGKLEQALQKVRINNHLESVEANLLSKQVNLLKLKTQLMKTNIELAGEESKLSSLMTQSKKYPNMAIEDLMSTQVNNKSLTAKRSFLSKSVAQLSKEIPQLEDKVLQMGLQEEQLERQVKILESSFLVLTKRLEDIRVSESEKTSDIRLISKAIEPHFPIGPNRFKIVLIALVLGLVAGMTIALSKEHLDNIS
jgi:uncharacterized protein involved in exopolysaccharide biosynthesis